MPQFDTPGLAEDYQTARLGDAIHAEVVRGEANPTSNRGPFGMRIEPMRGFDQPVPGIGTLAMYDGENAHEFEQRLRTHRVGSDRQVARPAPEVPLGQMDFGSALRMAKIGAKVTRRQWARHALTPSWVMLQRPDQHSKMTDPYLYVRAADGRVHPWSPSMEDMLAEDWFGIP